MNKRETEKRAQMALEAAEAVMDALEEGLDDVIAVLGPDETAHWLRGLADSMTTLSDCEGEA